MGLKKFKNKNAYLKYQKIHIPIDKRKHEINSPKYSFKKQERKPLSDIPKYQYYNINDYYSDVAEAKKNLYKKGMEIKFLKNERFRK